MKSRRKALLEFRLRVEEAIHGDYLFAKKPQRDLENGEDGNGEIVTLWGVPLLPSEGHEGTDAVLMKFLKAKRYKVHEAFALLRKTLKWRGDFMPMEVADQDLIKHRLEYKVSLEDPLTEDLSQEVRGVHFLPDFGWDFRRH